jgi:hypothetical protein
MMMDMVMLPRLDIFCQGLDIGLMDDLLIK